MKLIEVIGEILGYSAGAALLYLLYILRKKIFTKAHNIIKENDIILYEEIVYELSSLMALSCDRAYILEFHNGEQFSSEMPIWKFTCSYEIVKPGVSRSQDRLRGVPVSLFIDYIKIFYVEKDKELPNGITKSNICSNCHKCDLKCVIKFDVDKMDEGIVKAELKMRGVYGMYQIGIRDRNNRLIGILGIDYIKKEHWEVVKNTDEEFAHELKTVMTKIVRIWEDKKWR